MTMSGYFTDREFGARARVEQVISPEVWAGAVAIIEGLVQSGAFGMKFPESCRDGQAICGHDAESLSRSVRALLPGLEWPLKVEQESVDSFPFTREAFAPATPQVLDLLEFVHASIGKPIPGWHHDFARHHHLSFDQQTGQTDFRNDINLLFSRNGIAYEMQSTGWIARVLPAVIGDELKRTYFHTGDRTLDNFLEECRIKFSHRDPLVRREGLERLCDAWERLKTLPGPNKRESIRTMLDAVTKEEPLRTRLEEEARELTDIANAHLLRHSEVHQAAVIDVAQVDYLFHRLFAMINLLLQKQ
jgi:hypothetical protein